MESAAWALQLSNATLGAVVHISPLFRPVFFSILLSIRSEQELVDAPANLPDEVLPDEIVALSLVDLNVQIFQDQQAKLP